MPLTWYAFGVTRVRGHGGSLFMIHTMENAGTLPPYASFFIFWKSEQEKVFLTKVLSDKRFLCD